MRHLLEIGAELNIEYINLHSREKVRADDTAGKPFVYKHKTYLKPWHMLTAPKAECAESTDS